MSNFVFMVNLTTFSRFVNNYFIQQTQEKNRLCSQVAEVDIIGSSAQQENKGFDRDRKTKDG